uniref:Uncharacterized protein n=1 Tax=Meloidogyne enterolobii TaxID=390850 RepID=A0A6V7XFL8_MELEN|nr:unnamed protein product [Meloidogyne enterolobii]
MQKKTSFKSIIFWFKNLFKGKKKKEEEKNILNKFNKFGCFEFKWLGKLKKNLVGKKKIKLGKKGGGRVKRFVENKKEYFNELIRQKRRDERRKYDSNSSEEEEEEEEVEVEVEEEYEDDDENEGERKKRRRKKGIVIKTKRIWKLKMNFLVKKGLKRRKINMEMRDMKQHEELIKEIVVNTIKRMEEKFYSKLRVIIDTMITEKEMDIKQVLNNIQAFIKIKIKVILLLPPQNKLKIKKNI